MQHFAHHFEENYLKALYKLEQRDIKKVNNTALANTLELHPATVLQMVRKLSDNKLVDIQKDKSLRLTNKGRSKAIEITRKHRLWEVFLVEKLKYNWTEVHDLAEQLEHIESEDLIKRLDAFLGFPSSDPHGDPIPDKNGKIKKIKTQKLSDSGVREKVMIVNLDNSSDDFLRYLDKVGLSIGDTIEIIEIEEFDRSVIVMHKKNSITLSREAAHNILVTL